MEDNDIIETPKKRKRRKRIPGRSKLSGKSDEEKREIVAAEAGQMKQIVRQRNNVQKFLKRMAVGCPNKIEAFREIFPEANDWSYSKVWRHINNLLLRHSSSNALKTYRNKWLEMLEQKKVDLLLYLEQEIIYNDDKRIRAYEKLKAIETFAKLAGFTAPAPTVIQQINVKENNEKELLTIFGMDEGAPIENKDDTEIIDAQIVEAEENDELIFDIDEDLDL